MLPLPPRGLSLLSPWRLCPRLSIPAAPRHSLLVGPRHSGCPSLPAPPPPPSPSPPCLALPLQPHWALQFPGSLLV